MLTPEFPDAVVLRSLPPSCRVYCDATQTCDTKKQQKKRIKIKIKGKREYLLEILNIHNYTQWTE